MTPTLRRVLSGRFTTTPGCGPACSIAYGHDAATHEMAGRRQAISEMTARRPTGRVSIGPLLVDLDRMEVLVEGLDPQLSPLEREIVMVLAQHAGRAISYRALVEAVWGPEVVLIQSRKRGGTGPWHLVRVHMARVRAKLGPGGRLLETVVGYGVRVGPAPPAETDGAS